MKPLWAYVWGEFWEQSRGVDVAVASQIVVEVTSYQQLASGVQIVLRTIISKHRRSKSHDKYI